MRVRLVRAGPGGKWHLDPAAAGPHGGWCPRLAIRSGDAGGRGLDQREANAVADAGWCRACAARLDLPCPAGAYLHLARLTTATMDWTTALEVAASSADWLTCVRWTARTPFTEPCAAQPSS